MQTAELQTEEQIILVQSEAQITLEVIAEIRVLIDPEPIHSAEPPFPKIDRQEPLVPLREEISEKVIEEVTTPAGAPNESQLVE